MNDLLKAVDIEYDVFWTMSETNHSKKEMKCLQFRSLFVRLFSSYTRHETDGESNDKKYAHGGDVVSDTTVSYVDVLSIGEQKGKRKTICFHHCQMMAFVVTLEIIINLNLIQIKPTLHLTYLTYLFVLSE